jgi:hypothetical protein
VAVDIRGVKDRLGVPQGRSIALLALFSLSVLAVVAVEGDVRWVVGGFGGSTPFSDPSWGLSFASLQIVAILGPILPEITLVMLFGWVAALVVSLVSGSAKSWISEASANWSSPSFQALSSQRVSLVMLGAAIGISAFVGAHPYLHAINPNFLMGGRP